MTGLIGFFDVLRVKTISGGYFGKPITYSLLSTLYFHKNMYNFNLFKL